VEEVATEDDCGVVVLEDAVAWDSATTVSFVGWEYAGAGTLHRSRNSVHLRSDAPIAGIAWVHCWVEACLVQDELS
jgi:hypothetical protein